MTMPDPSRSRPKPSTVRPSGVTCVLIRTTAETRSSIQGFCAEAVDPVMTTANIAAVHARAQNGRVVEQGIRTLAMSPLDVSRSLRRLRGQMRRVLAESMHERRRCLMLLLQPG